MECVTLIDISLEDDLLIPSCSQGLGSETFSNLEAENTERACKQIEELSEFSESPQQKRRRSDRYSLRKSLAWDSEFFTSEGVLNPEELAIYNSTYSKANGLKLPEIHEELRKSVESTSTLDGESRALENSEVHLFENLRASSKRTLSASNKADNMEHSGKAKEQRRLDKPHLRSLKKIDISPQTKVASGNRQSWRSNKPPEISSTTPLRAVHGKISSSAVNKQVKSDRGKVLPGIAAKRQASLALNKGNNDPVMASRSIPSKESTLRTPQTGFKLVSASCSSSSSRPASSSFDSSSSRLKIMRNSTRNTTCSSSNFSSKTPLKATRTRIGSTNQIGNSSLGNSTVLLPRVSPSSSLDSFLSESSSQTSTSTKHSSSLKGSISSSCISFSTEKSGGALSQSFTANHSKKIDSDSKGTASLGLRMPRPRIGYFDKEKTQLHGSIKYLQTSLSSSLAKKNGISETSAANRCKLTNPYSKSTGGQMVLKTADKNQIFSPKLQNESSPKTAGGNCRKNLESKTEHPNLLQPKLAVMENEINGGGEQSISDQALFLNAVSGAEKENLCPESRTEGRSRALRTGGRYNTVTMLEGMVSSLSLSELKEISFHGD